MTNLVGYAAGTLRTCSPEETWQRIAPMLTTAGITRVSDITWLDTLGIPVWQAVRPESLVLSVSQGKGATDVAAKVSAVMESLETWHAEEIPVERTASSTFLDLGYDPAHLTLAAGSLFHPEARIDWVGGTELRTGARTWLPHQLLEVDFRPLHRYRPPLFLPTSNGLASGNTWDEATLHGLLELLERESLVAAGTTAPVLDLTTVDDPICMDLIDRMSTDDNEVVVRDMTGHEQVPCYAACLRSTGIGIDFDGSGAHLDPAIALSRALTEAAQARAGCISGAREDIDPGVYRVLGALLPPPRRLAAPETDHVVAMRRPKGTPERISDSLALVVEVAAEVSGSEPICVRLDRGLGLPVVRVVLPGARRGDAFTQRRPDAAASAR